MQDSITKKEKGSKKLSSARQVSNISKILKTNINPSDF